MRRIVEGPKTTCIKDIHICNRAKTLTLVFSGCILTLFSKILKSFSHSFTFLNGDMRNLRFGMKSHKMQLFFPSFSILVHTWLNINCNLSSSGWVYKWKKTVKLVWFWHTGNSSFESLTIVSYTVVVRY